MKKAFLAFGGGFFAAVGGAMISLAYFRIKQSSNAAWKTYDGSNLSSEISLSILFSVVGTAAAWLCYRALKKRAPGMPKLAVFAPSALVATFILLALAYKNYTGELKRHQEVLDYQIAKMREEGSRKSDIATPAGGASRADFHRAVRDLEDATNDLRRWKETIAMSRYYVSRGKHFTYGPAMFGLIFGAAGIVGMVKRKGAPASS